jgi:hypothetical protein
VSNISSSDERINKGRIFFDDNTQKSSPNMMNSIEMTDNKL